MEKAGMIPITEMRQSVINFFMSSSSFIQHLHHHLVHANEILLLFRNAQNTGKAAHHISKNLELSA
jgi:hypothetical protein